MRILFVLSGLHRHDRGAEIQIISVANELAKGGDTVTLIGSGPDRPEHFYHYIKAASIRRECFESLPSMPVLRSEFAYEELTFVPDLLRRYHPTEYDITLTCSYPFTNWILRGRTSRGSRPPHIFITHNSDWPAIAGNSEFRFFGCEGLICNNPDFYERNKRRWRCTLIPNGVDTTRFFPAVGQRKHFGLPEDRLIVLTVSALDPGKGVDVGIEAVHHLADAHFVVAGDGPLRHQIDAKAAALLPGRYTRLTVPPERMPMLYSSADIFLHLSTAETFGNVYIEAMACGLPIVALDLPRLRWIVKDGEYLIDAMDPLAVSRIIERVRDMPQDRQKRADKAAIYSWPVIASKYRNFIRGVMRKEGGSAEDAHCTWAEPSI